MPVARGDSYVEHDGVKFLITDRPSAPTLPRFLESLEKRSVTNLVRVCDPSYETDVLTKAGIEVSDMPYPDGDPPPEDVVTQWLELCTQTFDRQDPGCIAVHCVAGLGRAPVMVAVALMERGVAPEDAVDMIREVRRGAFNSKQLEFLRDYKPRAAPKKKKGFFGLW
mmetsp:Transcript_24620/g.64178  ORF Transcript_24620/g.64178 Transcript_24620/m.64178 type:complete len:167 (-) Transcript_24620:1550-2050(-)